MEQTTSKKNNSLIQGEKLRSAKKVQRIPAHMIDEKSLAKPSWIRVSASFSKQTQKIKDLLRENKLHSVCEEASCPNLNECFANGTATFMIMGDICTRRCAFCDVAFGRPNALDENEPLKLAQSIAKLDLKYVVITSVDRDDLLDGGAEHFAKCIKQIKDLTPHTKIEILVPDFKKRMDTALAILAQEKPDVFNHNIETVPRLYKIIRPGADYQHSLNLLKNYKEKTNVLTKSGIMLGLGETKQEVEQTLEDLANHQVDLITIGQYLRPSLSHFPVQRYVHPDEFDYYASLKNKLGLKEIISGPMVRSSYHADQQAHSHL